MLLFDDELDSDDDQVAERMEQYTTDKVHCSEEKTSAHALISPQKTTARHRGKNKATIESSDQFDG